jgi:hypothetical protein
MVQDVAAQLTQQFADCLQRQLSTPAPAEGVAAPPPAKPVGGISLFLGALIRSARRVVKRITRRA